MASSCAWSPIRNTFPSEKPVVLVRGLDQITADTLDYHGDARVAELTGRVKAAFAPRP